MPLKKSRAFFFNLLPHPKITLHKYCVKLASLTVIHNKTQKYIYFIKSLLSSIGITKPTTIADITIIQSRLVNLNMVCTT